MSYWKNFLASHSALNVSVLPLYVLSCSAPALLSPSPVTILQRKVQRRRVQVQVRRTTFL